MSSIDVIAKPYDSKYKRTWAGSFDKSIIFFQMYIQERYKDIAYQVPLSFILFEKENPGKGYLSFSVNGKYVFDFSKDKESDGSFSIALNYDKDTRESYKIYKQYISKLRNNNKRFIFFKYSVRNKGSYFHSVLILYDRVTKELEFFQRNPGFRKYSAHEEGIEYVVSFFESVFGKGIKPVFNKGLCIETAKISNICKKFFSEEYSKINGDCLIWVLWYLELRLKNKDIPRRSLVNRALKSLYEDSKICEVILGYRKFIDDFTDQFIVTYGPKETIILNKKKTTPLLKKAEKLIKEYLFYTGIFSNKRSF